MHDRPLLLAERVHAEVGDHAAGIAVIGAEAEQPRIAGMGQIRIGAADHHRLAELEHVGRHRLNLGRADRAEKRDDIRLRGELGKGQHDAGVGGLVVFDHELDLLAEDAAGLVHGCQRELGAVLRPETLLGGGPVTGTHMPILMVEPCARALVMMWGAAIPATMPAAKSRLVSLINSSLRPGVSVGLSWSWRTAGVRETDCYLRSLKRSVNWY